MSRRARVTLLAVTLGTLVPALASACATCTGADDRNKGAFLGSTLFLSLLPLAFLVAGFVWWARGGRAWLAREFVDRDAWSPEPPAAPAGTPGDAPHDGMPTRA